MKRFVTLVGAFCLMVAGLVPALVMSAVLPAGADPGPIYVDAAAGNDLYPGSQLLPKQTIQAGIDLVDPGGTVYVRPGNYSETAANVSPVSIGGTYTFGLFLGKDGITVQGVHADDTPITVASDPAMPVVKTNSTANFGPDGVFVEGDGDTITGLHISENLPSGYCNKTIEVVGDAFTFSNGIVDDPCGGDIYIDDFRYDVGTDTPHVNSYTITGSEFRDGNTIDIGSGPGHGTPASNRVISNNTFVGGGFRPVISFNGADSGIPWFVYPVGGATITGNTFAARDQYIRARGTYDTATFDWDSYYASNTFPRAALTKTSTNDVRSYAYTAPGASWNDVRRINGTLQTTHGAGCAGNDCNGDVDNAQPGDTVQIRGTFNENVSLTQAVSLLGINGPTLNGSTTGVAVNSPGALSIQGIRFTGSNPSIGVANGSVAPLVLRNSLEDLINSTTTVDARCNWWGVASGSVVGQTYGPVMTAPFLTTSNLAGACKPIAGLSAGSVRSTEGNSGSHTVTLTVNLNGPSTTTATVYWHTQSGTASAGDFMGGSGSLVFAPGQTSKPITVTVFGDTTLEQNETFYVNLWAATNATIGGVPRESVIIGNDEKPTLNLTVAPVTEGAKAQFAIGLAQQYYLPLTLTVTTIAGTAQAGIDYTTVSRTIVVPAYTTGIQTILVQTLLDSTTEAAQSFSLRVTSGLINNSPKIVPVTIRANTT